MADLNLMMVRGEDFLSPRAKMSEISALRDSLECEMYCYWVQMSTQFDKCDSTLTLVGPRHLRDLFTDVFTAPIQIEYRWAI